MKVKTRLLVIFWLSNFVAVTTGFLLFYNARVVDREIDHLVTVESIRQGVTEIVDLRNLYFAKPSEELVMQIRQRYEGMNTVMRSGRGMFDEPQIVALFDEMLRFKDQNVQIFDVLQKSVGKADAKASEEYASALRHNSIAIQSRSHEVIDNLLKRLHNLHERMMMLIIVFTLTLLTGISTAIGIIWSSIVKRILFIRQGSTEVAGGNFNFAWSDGADDEIGELSRDLAAMAKQIDASYSKLEEKVCERTRELEEMKDSLESKVLELEEAKKTTLRVLQDLEHEKVTIEEANAKNQAILASMDDGFIATDKEGNVMLVNSRAEAMLGWSGIHVIGKSLFSVLTVRDETKRILSMEERPMHLVIERKEPVHVSSKYEFVRHDGTTFPVYVAAAPIILDGKIIGALEVFRDVTEEKEIERAKSEFISVAAHQLRTPAAAMNWYLERLINGRMGKLTGKQMEYFREIERNNQRMIELVNTLLNVSRLEIGVLNIQPAPLDVQKLIAKTLAELRPMIEKKHISVEVSSSGEPMAFFDPEFFSIVMSNLLSNAVNYTPPRGTVCVRAERVAAGAEMGGKPIADDSIFMVVEDTGYGIPEREQAQLFTKFFRADNARTKHTDGNGLGLYIVKSILDQMGGKIWFRSSEDKGTAFYITLPENPPEENVSP